MSIKQIIKSTARWLTLSVAVFLFFIGILYAVVQTKPGKAFLAKSLQYVFSSGTDRQVRIGSISGHIPFRIQFETITLSDQEGPWLVVKNSSIDWKPFGIIKGDIYVSEWRTEEIGLGPVPRPGREIKESGASLPSWPLPIPSFTMERLLIERLEIHTETPGKDAVFSVKGSMLSSRPTHGLSGSLRIDRVGPSESFAVINWDVSGKEPMVKIDTRMRNLDEEMILAISGLKETGPVDLSLTGEGPARKWKGQLAIRSEKLGRVHSDFEIRMKDGLRVIGSGSILPGPYFVPAELFPLVGDRDARFSLDMEYGAGREVIFHTLFLETDGSSVRMNGSLDLERDRIDSRFQIGIKDISLFKRILGGEPRGRLELRGVLSGSLENPRSELALSISNPGFEDFYAGKIESEIQVQGSGKSPLAFHAVDIDGKVAVAGPGSKRADFPLPFDHVEAFFHGHMEKGKPLLIHGIQVKTDDVLLRGSGGFEPESRVIDGEVNVELADFGRFSAFLGPDVDGRMHFKGGLRAGLKTGDLNAQLKGGVDGFRFADHSLPFERFDWDFAINRKRGSPLEIKRLSITTQDLSMDYSGSLDPDLLRIDGVAEVNLQDFGWFSARLGSGITGKIGLKAGLRADLKAGDLSADLKGRIGDFQSFPAYLDPVLRGGADFRGRVELREGKKVHLSGVQMDADVFQFTGEGSLNLEDKGITARTHLSVPGLYALSGIIKKEIDGSLELDLETSGAYPNPEVAAEATVRGMHIQGFSIHRARLSVQADNLTQGPRGNLRLSLDLEEGPVRAETGFTWEKGDLILNRFISEGPGIHVDGELAIHVESLITRGDLKIKADDLSPLSSLWGERMEGSVMIDASLEKGAKGQDLSLSASGKRLAGLSGRVEDLKLISRIHDLYGDPEGEATLEIKAFQRGAVRLETGKIEAKGGFTHIHYSVNGDGTYRDPFHFRASGSTRFPGEEILFRLERFQGDYRGYPVLLVQPVIVRKKQNHYRIEESSFSLAGGTFRSSAEIGPEFIAVEAVLKDMPLDILDMTGMPDLKGMASTKLRIGGNPSHPEVEAVIRIEDIQSPDRRYQHMPPARSNIEISYRDNRLKGDMTLEGLSERPFKAVIQVPLSFSLSPVSLSLGQEGQIQGAIFAETNIDRIPLFFNLEDHIMDGDLRVDLDIAGSIEKPEIRGDVMLTKGAYENPGAGIVMRDIHLTGNIENDRFVLQELRAKDGENGILQANGRLRFHLEDRFPYRLEFHVKNYALVRSDPFSLKTDANLTFSGTTEEAVLSGLFQVTSAELRIPERLPMEVYELEVTEINAPERHIPKKTDSRENIMKRLKLDIGIEVPGRVFVRGRGLDSEWKGDLKISGSAAEPLILGDVAVVRGKYNFFGKLFSLSKGFISFEGQHPPVPRFNVTAEHKLRDITARIRITGSTSAPDIQVESDPPLPPDEVLARLLFGRSAGDMTPFQALRLAQAVNAMRGGGGGILNFFDRTRRWLGVDQLDIRQSDQEGGDTSLSAGKYVRENVYLEVEKGVDTERGKVSVEVELTPDITLESEVGVDSETGMGINWKWDY